MIRVNPDHASIKGSEERCVIPGVFLELTVHIPVPRSMVGIAKGKYGYNFGFVNFCDCEFPDYTR